MNEAPVISQVGVFDEFPKIARFARECIITEKIDGTNGQIWIGDGGEFLVGSRSRWITSEQDNHGFARWAYEHKDELLLLGPGRHFGEWWGGGIQRGYGLTKGEKRFSLFNVSRWVEDWHKSHSDNREPLGDGQEYAPPCCHVVPILARGCFSGITLMAESVLLSLQENGSSASPGFMKPEGIIIFHLAGNVGFKRTLEKDEMPKSRS